MTVLDRIRRSGSTKASPVLASARWRHSLLAQPFADDAAIEALEHSILDAPQSLDPATRERELRAQGEILLQRVEGVHDSLDPASAEREQLRVVVAFLYKMAGLEVPERLAA